MKINLKYLVSIAIFAVLGFSREFLFVNINNQLFTLYYQNVGYTLPNSLWLFSDLDYTTLYYLKYFLTIFYFLLYFLTSFLTIKSICLNKKNAIWIIYIYALLLVLSSISMAYNYMINNQLGGDEYTISRWLMGIAQSPLVTFFIIASSKLYTKFQPQP